MVRATTPLGLLRVRRRVHRLVHVSHIRWAERKQVPAKVAEELLEGAGALAVALIGKTRFAGLKDRLEAWVGREGVNAAMSAAAKLGVDQLRKMNLEARAKQDYMAEVLTRFGLDLDKGEEDRILLRSRR